ncbi:MAG: NYN domain-containing protein [Bradyrhizobiaceae bacterium]|nr:NYN domain-containing protein [Bradyrhizobiaceae bacterium]
MKYATLIDGGYFKAEWQKHKKASKVPGASDVAKLIAEIHRNLDSVHSGIRLLRTYFYDCDPYSGTQSPPNGSPVDFSKSNQYRYQKKLLQDLSKMESIAVRRGEIKFRGWDVNGKTSTPRFVQKGVDMKIGLDVAWLATKKIVDSIVLVTGDSDFIAPMKLARTEGVEVWIVGIGSTSLHSLVEHSDRHVIYSF